MCPAPNFGLPSRPKFPWDAKCAPWINGKGDQEQYNVSLTLWNAFLDVLPDSNRNKITEKLCVTCLKYQLFGRAENTCSAITNEEVLSDDGIKNITEAIYQRDALSAVSEAFGAFNLLWNTCRSNTEAMKNFESRLSA